jgi:hypothetical protein
MNMKLASNVFSISGSEHRIHLTERVVRIPEATSQPFARPTHVLVMFVNNVETISASYDDKRQAERAYDSLERVLNEACPNCL